MAPTLELQGKVEAQYLREMDGGFCTLSSYFIRDYHLRAVAGRKQYGDASWDLPPHSIVDNAMEEAVDIPGWLKMLYARAVRECYPQRVIEEIVRIGAAGAKLYDDMEHLLDMLSEPAPIKPLKGMAGNPILGSEINDYKDGD